MPFVFDVRLRDVDRFYFAGGSQIAEIVSRGCWQSGAASASHDRIYQVFRPEIQEQMRTLKLVRVPRLRTAREADRPSLQVTWVQLGEIIYGDMDIDLSSPLMDVVGFFTHLLEILVPGPTDHMKLAKRLRKEGYDV